MSYIHVICWTMIELKSDNKTEQSSVYSIILLFYRHTICWTMIELKSIVKSDQSSVNILLQFWIESDNRSSHRFWILKFIYQNYTTSTLYHYRKVLSFKFVRGDFKWRFWKFSYSYWKSTSHIFRKVIDFDILPKNVLNQSKCSIF